MKYIILLFLWLVNTLYKVTNEILFELKIRHLLAFMIGWQKRVHFLWSVNLEIFGT